jgi:alkaline phosphatase D
MPRKLVFCLLPLLLSIVRDTSALPLPAHDTVLERVTFGSCAKPKPQQSVWASIVRRKPDLFIFLGDNVYADARKPEELAATYAAFARNPGLQYLKSKVPILATWDDHDYGRNDMGAENPIKQDSQQLFLDFFGVAADDPRRKRSGIYHSYLLGPTEKQVQIILLDTRYFRDPLVRENPKKAHRYTPSRKPAATILGERQWRWLERTLQQPAQLRIVASSIQTLPTQHPFEKWANFPAERERLLRLLNQPNLGKVILLSGDRHHGEISALMHAGRNTLFEVTSSGLTTSGGPSQQNQTDFALVRWSVSPTLANSHLIGTLLSLLSK